MILFIWRTCAIILESPQERCDIPEFLTVNAAFERFSGNLFPPPGQQPRKSRGDMGRRKEGS